MPNATAPHSNTEVNNCAFAAKALVPTMETFEGAVMVADISGFTRLTEQLSHGVQTAFGVELLTKCMNNYFSRVRASGVAPLQQPASGRPGA